MAGYLKRLVSSLGAYQIADVVSKLMAILLLPVYTRYIPTSGYGIVETLATFVIFVSIVVRLGIIEAFLRFYFTDDDAERRDALARRAVLFLLLTTTVACVILFVFAAPLSKLVTSQRIPGSFRVAVLGVWAFTNLELAYALLRVDERLRAYATATLINVLLTIAASLVLVVGLHKSYNGLLIANYGASTIVLLALWWTMRDRLLRTASRRRGPGAAVALRPADGSGRGICVRAQRARPPVHRPRARTQRRRASIRSRSRSPAPLRSSCEPSSMRGRRSHTRSPTTPRRRGSTAWSRPTTS